MASNCLTNARPATKLESSLRVEMREQKIRSDVNNICALPAVALPPTNPRGQNISSCSRIFSCLSWCIFRSQRLKTKHKPPIAYTKRKIRILQWLEEQSLPNGVLRVQEILSQAMGDCEHHEIPKEAKLELYEGVPHFHPSQVNELIEEDSVTKSHNYVGKLEENLVVADDNLLESNEVGTNLSPENEKTIAYDATASSRCSNVSTAEGWDDKTTNNNEINDHEDRTKYARTPHCLESIEPATEETGATQYLEIDAFPADYFNAKESDENPSTGCVSITISIDNGKNSHARQGDNVIFQNRLMSVHTVHSETHSHLKDTNVLKHSVDTAYSVVSSLNRCGD